MKTAVRFTIALLFALVADGAEHRTGSVQVSGGAKGVSLAGVHLGRQLVYAFAWPTAVPKTDTNDPSSKPAQRGIHFVYTTPNGLWFNGKKVVFPSDVQVFALRADGQVVPIPLDKSELQQATELTNPGKKTEVVPEGSLKRKLLAPFEADAAEK